MNSPTRPTTADATCKPKRPRAPRHPQDHATAFIPDALLTVALTCDLTGLSRATIYTKARAGKFPQPVKLSARCTRWRAGDVTDWLKAQAHQQPAAVV